MAFMKSLDAYENSFDNYEEYALDVFEKHSKIIDNVTNVTRLNNQAFDKVINEANKYGFGDILKEAKYYLAMNNALLRQIVKASKYYIERVMNYEGDRHGK